MIVDGPEVKRSDLSKLSLTDGPLASTSNFFIILSKVKLLYDFPLYFPSCYDKRSIVMFHYLFQIQTEP